MLNKQFGSTLIIFLLTAMLPALAQRNYSVFDSTVYPINSQLSYIAGKKKLYSLFQGNVQLIKDFSMSDSDYYIRDVDFFDAQTGFVLLGNRYIGHPTYLYQTTNAGQTWDLDTSFYSVSEHKSLNQVQVLGSDTLILFDGYYMSDVLRSYNRGKTWEKWISSLIAHYFQLHNCAKTNRYHLIGLPGDAFASVSFEVPDSIWKGKNQGYMSGCHNVKPWCHRVNHGVNIWAVDFIAAHKQYIDSICNTPALGISSLAEPTSLGVYPNPTKNWLNVSAWTNKTVTCYNTQGSRVALIMADQEGRLSLENLPTGVYYLEYNRQFIKVLKLQE